MPLRDGVTPDRASHAQMVRLVQSLILKRLRAGDQEQRDHLDEMSAQGLIAPGGWRTRQAQLEALEARGAFRGIGPSSPPAPAAPPPTEAAGREPALPPATPSPAPGSSPLS